MVSRKVHILARAGVERVWTAAVGRLGFRVERTREAYASTNGNGVIFVGVDDTLDDDDSFAQLVFHEICHALVQGRAYWNHPDWGLDNTTSRDDVKERACLRLQAHLADQYGLRVAMTPTTIWRDEYQSLGPDPLRVRNVDEEEACALAEKAMQLVANESIAPVIAEALALTANEIAGDLLHPSGFQFGNPNKTCGGCGWIYEGGRGPAVTRCRQSAGEREDGKRVLPSMPACQRWEPALDCQTCGACCREAYHVVSVGVRDPVVWKHPHMIVRNGHRFSLARTGDRCASLGVVDSAAPQTFACQIYEDRPQTCRDFTRGGVHCVTARRRVGLVP